MDVWDMNKERVSVLIQRILKVSVDSRARTPCLSRMHRTVRGELLGLFCHRPPAPRCFYSFFTPGPHGQTYQMTTCHGYCPLLGGGYADCRPSRILVNSSGELSIKSFPRR